MNINFFLTVESRPNYKVGQKHHEVFVMVICNVNKPMQPIFTSYTHPDKDALVTVGKAYAKRLDIIFKEPEWFDTMDAEVIGITHIKYFSEYRTINLTLEREPDKPLPQLQDILSFGSPRRWMVTKTEERGDTLWVWLGNPG